MTCRHTKSRPNRVALTGLRPSGLPHHPAYGSVPGGSNQTLGNRENRGQSSFLDRIFKFELVIEDGSSNSD